MAGKSLFAEYNTVLHARNGKVVLFCCLPENGEIRIQTMKDIEFKHFGENTLSYIPKLQGNIWGIEVCRASKLQDAAVRSL